MSNFGYGSPFRPGYPDSGSGRSYLSPGEKMTRSAMSKIIIAAFIQMIFGGLVFFFIFKFLGGFGVGAFFGLCAGSVGFIIGLGNFSQGYQTNPFFEKILIISCGLLIGAISTFITFWIVESIFKNLFVQIAILVSVFIVASVSFALIAIKS